MTPAVDRMRYDLAARVAGENYKEAIMPPDPLIETARQLRSEDETLWRRLRVAAAVEGVTLRELLRRALQEYLDLHYPARELQ